MRDIRKLSMISGAMLLATAASAAPVNVVSSEAIATRAPIEDSAYCARRSMVGYYGYSGVLVAAPTVAADGIYCATSVKTCLLREPGWLGTGCSCSVPGGYARGLVQ